MKERTISEIHDREIGHSKFAWFCDKAKDDGYEIANIREYNEKFKFRMNGIDVEFVKDPKANARFQYEQCVKLINYYEQLEKMR